MDNKDIYLELLDIGYNQEMSMNITKKNAEILGQIAQSVSQKIELPNLVVPDEFTIKNFPEIQKVEVTNQEKIDLSNVEGLLTKLIKVVPTLKDDKPTEAIEKLSQALISLLSQDKSKEQVLEVLTAILQKEYPAYQLPETLISKEGRIKVEVDRAGSGGSGITKESIDALIGNDALRMVEVGSVIYLGKAEIATATSSAKWQVKKIDQTSGIIITWADGNDLFDNIFDDYLTLNYL